MSALLRSFVRHWPPFAAMLALSGCASLLGVAPPGHLYRLSAAPHFAVPLPHVPGVLRIERPEAPAGIDTTRIALSRTPLSLDYYADSEWTDRAPAMVQQALLTSFENSGAITAIGDEAIGLPANLLLDTELRHFEAEYPAAGNLPRVRVTMVVRLVAMPGRRIVAQKRFERLVPAAANTIPDVVAAFNAATNAVIGDIVTWTIANAALSGARS
ncbi:MAG TPA: ABC-type transport auxiliary lipoprotein family protein [Stellaceae bacterium]|nr:ABC-type transport auxiliary lipoprotein family protein [Stellaceae bacterium]